MSERRRLLAIGPALRPALAMFALVALALIGGVMLIFSTLQAERAQRRAATTNAAVLAALRDVSRDAVDGETGARGYFITLDERYLAPYTVARARIGLSLDRLARLAHADRDPGKRALLGAVGALARAKFADLDATVALVRARNVHEAQRRILTDSGQATMEQLRHAVIALEGSERDELAEADRQVAASEAWFEPLLLALLAIIVIALFLTVQLAIHAADAESRAAGAAALAEARDRADLLARELNHRVKNLFAVVLAIVQMSARGGGSEAKATVASIDSRIRALLKAHEVTQGSPGAAGGQARVQLAALVETVLAPHRSGERPCTIEGPPVELTPAQASSLGLMLHELATNAVKYGAWSQPGGALAVAWQGGEAPGTIDFAWREHCAFDPAPPGSRVGFGTQLLKTAVRQLDGSFTRNFHADGLELRIAMVLNKDEAA